METYIHFPLQTEGPHFVGSPRRQHNHLRQNTEDLKKYVAVLTASIYDNHFP